MPSFIPRLSDFPKPNKTIPAQNEEAEDSAHDVSWFYKALGPIDIEPILQFLDKGVWSKDPVTYTVNCERMLAPFYGPLVKALEAVTIPLRAGSKLKLWDMRKINPGGYIKPHTDPEVRQGQRRLHIPIVSHPDIKLQWPDREYAVYLEPGQVYEVNPHIRHIVTNPTDVARVHLMIDFKTE